MTDGPRTLVLDIETLPALVLSYSTGRGVTITPGQIVEPFRMSSIALKWYGERKVFYFDEFTDGRSEMLSATAELVDEADVVVGYNSKGFDMKRLRGEWAVEEIDPPSPFRDLDLYLALRSTMKFDFMKLGFVLERLGLDGKDDGGGYARALAQMNGDEKAWKANRRYNVRDVRATEELLDRVRPYLPATMPNAGAYFDDGVPRCAKVGCGSTDLVRWGYLFTNAGKRQRYRCNSCGGYSTAPRAISTPELRGA